MIRALTCHPDTPARRVAGVRAEWTVADGGALELAFVVDGIESLSWPKPTSPRRTDGLWRATCFELFWKPLGDDGYVEVNLSPSGCWATYAFNGYRAGMRDLTLPRDPVVERLADGIQARLDLSGLRRPARGGLSAVIEEMDGTKSYWALAHPHGAPDFHHPDCFALRIPAVA